MVKLTRKFIVAILLILTVPIANLAYLVFSQTPPPPLNTIEHNVGLYFQTVAAHDYFMRGYNLTDGIILLAEYVANYSLIDIWNETNVEWGLVYGTTGDWFDHTLPDEPVYIGLQMHPTNHTYDSVLVYPVVYDKSATQWQLGLYWFNGTQINGVDLLVMYHMRYEPDLEDPNDPQLPSEG